MKRNALDVKIPFFSGKWCFLYILCLSCIVAGCKDKETTEIVQPVKPVKLYSVQASNEVLSMALPGRVRAAKRSEMSFKVAGTLEKLPVEEGKLVKKGDLIAQILQRDFQTAIKEAMARELEANQQYQRYKELYSKRQVSKADFDRYRASRDVARAKLTDAKNALVDTTLRAPFDGVIAKRYVENFEKVQVKQPIAYLQLIDQLEILIDVPELRMAQFRMRESIDVVAEFDAAAGMKYPLTVKEFSTDADPATQTYQIVLAMDQPKEANILPGMTAKVIASAAEDNEVEGANEIVIPAIAVLNGADKQNYVWLFDPESMTVQKVQVTIGPLEGSKNVVVTKGLTGGEEIISAGVRMLREGMKVRPWESQREVK